MCTCEYEQLKPGFLETEITGTSTGLDLKVKSEHCHTFKWTLIHSFEWTLVSTRNP